MAEQTPASDQAIIQLYRDAATASATAMRGNERGGPGPRLTSTRAIIAQTLRWAADQLDPASEAAQSLRGWAEQVDLTVPCKCGRLYRLDRAAEHFGAVAHDWADIPDQLRGLPGGGRRAGHLN